MSTESLESNNTKECESHPFLKYTDDASDEASVFEPKDFQHAEARRMTMLLSHSLVFMITSAVWIVIVVAIGSPTKYWHSSSSSSTSASMDDFRHHSLSTLEGAMHRHNITSNARLIECGSSTAEARARGCIYDVLLNHWVPAECKDDEFVQEYQDDKSWDAFADEALTQRLHSIDEMSELDFYYTSTRDHINHCAVLWKKQFWMFFEESPVFDSVILTPYHTDHCSQYLVDVVEGNHTRATRVRIGLLGVGFDNGLDEL